MRPLIVRLLGLCCYRADCANTHCPGREIALELLRRPGDTPPPRWPAVTGGVIGFLCACAAAAACMGIQLFPF